MKGYVSDDERVGYCFFPKVACTTIKRALYELENGVKFSRELVGCHVHKYTSKRKVAIIDQCERRFVVIRDPIKRFLSAYSNRVTFHNELSENALRKFLENNKNIKIPFYNPTLDQFIEHFDVYYKVETIFHHARPMVEFLDGENLSFFSDVYKMEDLHAFEVELCNVFGKSVSFDRTQTGGVKFTLKELSEVQVQRLLSFYQRDYELLRGFYSEEAVWDEWGKEHNKPLSQKK